MSCLVHARAALLAHSRFTVVGNTHKLLIVTLRSGWFLQALRWLRTAGTRGNRPPLVPTLLSWMQ
eukprot:15433440-Alexandrium_andersonii.AAC.1